MCTQQVHGGEEFKGLLHLCPSLESSLFCSAYSSPFTPKPTKQHLSRAQERSQASFPPLPQNPLRPFRKDDTERQEVLLGALETDSLPPCTDWGLGVQDTDSSGQGPSSLDTGPRGVRAVPEGVPSDGTLTQLALQPEQPSFRSKENSTSTARLLMNLSSVHVLCR